MNEYFFNSFSAYPSKPRNEVLFDIVKRQLLPVINQVAGLFPSHYPTNKY